jgi:hypothetical protein
MVTNANLEEEGMKFLVFSSPVCLDCDDFPVKQTFHKVLKFNKFLKHLRFKFQGIDPGKFAKIINEANIILFSTCRFESITPNMLVNKFKRTA